MLNKAQVIGNLGQDPKVTPLNNGENKVASFSVATTEKGYTLRNGTQVPEKTEWHNIVCFGSLAEVASRYLHKGSKVFIEGKMRTRSYEDKQGIKRYLTEINAETLEMLDPKPQPRHKLQPHRRQQNSRTAHLSTIIQLPSRSRKTCRSN